jgi:hypothetical protein
VGILKSFNQYLGVNDVKVEGEEFASAGLGLNIPLSKIFNNWWCEGMLTSSQNVEDLEGPDQLQTHDV